MKMRRADARDLAAVNEITRRAYEHYVPILCGEPWPMRVDYAPRIEAGEVWLTAEPEAPVALIALEDHGDHLHIFSIAVLPEHQSKGVGRESRFRRGRRAQSRAPGAHALHRREDDAQHRHL